MVERERLDREALEIINTDMMVPQDHLLRKIDNAVDFTHIYDFVNHLYCENNGRPDRYAAAAMAERPDERPIICADR